MNNDTIEKTNLFYDLMLIANDDDVRMRLDRRRIAADFERITGQDLPENGWMVDEMAVSTGIASDDFTKLSVLVSEYWTKRN